MLLLAPYGRSAAIIGLLVAKPNLKMSGTVCVAKRQNSGAITLPFLPKMGHLFKLLMDGSWVILTLNLD